MEKKTRVLPKTGERGKCHVEGYMVGRRKGKPYKTTPSRLMKLDTLEAEAGSEPEG